MKKPVIFTISAVLAFGGMALAQQSGDDQPQVQVIKAKKVAEGPMQEGGGAEIDGQEVDEPAPPANGPDSQLDANGGNVSQPYEDYDENTGMKNVVPSDTDMGID